MKKAPGASAKTAVINTEREILVLTRSRWQFHRPGGLDWLGGRTKRNERPDDGARREAFEEGGLILGALQLLNVYSHKHPSYLFATIVPVGTAVELSPEHTKQQWVSLEAYPSLNNLPPKYIAATTQRMDVIDGLLEAAEVRLEPSDNPVPDFDEADTWLINAY